MIYLNNLPIPPSANSLYETNVYKINKINKAGKAYQGFGTSKRRSDELNIFHLKCMSYRNSNLDLIKQSQLKLIEWVKNGNVLKLEAIVAVEKSRLFTKEGFPKRFDADNRLKALQDGLSKILDIDDKWFFSGNVEKVTTTSKDYEQCLIKITPMKARTLQEIQNLKNEVGSIPHF